MTLKCPQCHHRGDDDEISLFESDCPSCGAAVAYEDWEQVADDDGDVSAVQCPECGSIVSVAEIYG